MRLFIAGATGTLGRPTVQLLQSHGHQVTGLTRSERGRKILEGMGARAVIGDALDAERVRTAVLEARPDQVVHLLTAIPAAGALRASQLSATNDLRIRATANLLEAAVEARAVRVVAESFVGIYAGAAATHFITEDEPLPAPRGATEKIGQALHALEDQLRRARKEQRIETVALRIGFLYGPDVPSSAALVRQALAGRLFVPSRLEGIAPFVRNSDAVAAIVAAIERPVPSFAYNVVDDRPTAMSAFLMQLTQAVGAAPPRQLPRWLVKLAAPLILELGSAQLRLSNAKIKRELGWAPRYPTIESGLRDITASTSKAA